MMLGISSVQPRTFQQSHGRRTHGAAEGGVPVMRGASTVPLFSHVPFCVLGRVKTYLFTHSLTYILMSKDDVIDKELFIVVTAEGGFSGDIDQKLIDWMIKSFDKIIHAYKSVV